MDPMGKDDTYDMTLSPFRFFFVLMLEQIQ